MGKKSTRIAEIIRGVKEFKGAARMDRVIIFGSAARGKMNEHSDVDLILVSKKFSGKDFFSRPLGLRNSWKLDFPVDFLCYSPDEFEKEKKKVSIVNEALREGIEV